MAYNILINPDKNIVLCKRLNKKKMWKLLNILPRIQSSFFFHFTRKSLTQVYSGFASTVTIRVLTLSASFSYWLLHQLTQDVSVKLPDYVISISADMCVFIITCLWADFHRRRRKDGGRVTARNHWVFLTSRGDDFSTVFVSPNPEHDPFLTLTTLLLCLNLTRLSRHDLSQHKM